MGIQSVGTNGQNGAVLGPFQTKRCMEKVAGNETFAKHLRLTSEVKR
jgi:hypothetical protein